MHTTIERIAVEMRMPSVIALVTILGAAIAAFGQAPQNISSNSCCGHKRPIAVRDIIEMTHAVPVRFSPALSKTDVAEFSPDGRQFVVLLKRGVLTSNTNVYSLVVFHIRRTHDTTFDHRVVASMSSGTNDPAISEVHWLNEHVLVFVGIRGDEQGSLYTVDTTTRTIKRLTNRREAVVTYAINPESGSFVAEIRRPIRPLVGVSQGNNSLVVGNEPLLDLVMNESRSAANSYVDLYSGQIGSAVQAPIPVSGNVVAGMPLYISPNGRFAVVMSTAPHDVPADWSHYQIPELQRELESSVSDDIGNVRQFQLLDLEHSTSRPLLNSPIPHGEYPDVVWSPDSRSVALSGILIPLNATIPIIAGKRFTTRYNIDVDICTDIIRLISETPVRLDRWDAGTGLLLGRTGKWEADAPDGERIAYKREDKIWQVAEVGTDHPAATSDWVIKLEQGINSSPKIYASNNSIDGSQMILDLNPQFRELQFAEVRDLGEIQAGNISVRAGVYLPPGYDARIRYPLVIQTHGWDPEQFWIDGPYTTAFAAQALAARGFIVAQVATAGRSSMDNDTPAELPDEMKRYEAVIDYLNDRDMIDVDKIGIIGFSRTVLGVEYALLHSRYHFAAATLADGSDYGYFHYVAQLNSPGFSLPAEGINGGIPAGAGLKRWLTATPEFNIDDVSTPVRLEALQRGSLLFVWEWFELSRRLKKPVELIYLPDSAHPAIRPLDRFVSQQGNVDWFGYWLQNDSRSLTAAARSRWGELHNMQASSAGLTSSKGSVTPTRGYTSVRSMR